MGHVDVAAVAVVVDVHLCHNVLLVLDRAAVAALNSVYNKAAVAVVAAASSYYWAVAAVSVVAVDGVAYVEVVMGNSVA